MTALAVGASAVDLVPGDPGDLDALARRLDLLADGVDRSASDVRSAQAGSWVGAAGDAFRAAVDEVPSSLVRAGAAFGAAAGTLRDYARVLREAQAEAARAVRMYEQGVAETARWQAQVAAYEGAVRRLAAAAEPDEPPAQPSRARPSSYDPGADDVRQAQALLSQAREDVERAATRAAGVLRSAADDAPREKRWWEKAWHQVSEFGKGAWEATAGTVTFLYSVTLQMYVDPQAWASDVADVGRGLIWGVQHPVEFGKAVLDWETWKTNPARALGRLVPDLIATVASGGAGAALRGTRGLRSLSRATALERAGLRIDDVARLSQADAAAVIARGDRFTPRTLTDLNGRTPQETEFGAPGPAGSWKDTPASFDSVPERWVLTNLHGSTRPGSHSFWSDPRELLEVGDEAAAMERFALLDEWYGGGSPAGYLPRDEVTIRIFEPGEAQRVQYGHLGPQTADAVTADPFTGVPRRQHVEGGAQQWLSQNPETLWDVPVSTWQGPPPWERLHDPAAWKGAAAGTGAGAAMSQGDEVSGAAR